MVRIEGDQWHMRWLQVAIRLEQMLYDFVLLNSAPSGSLAVLTPNTWDLVDKIATQQAQWS